MPASIFTRLLVIYHAVFIKKHLVYCLSSCTSRSLSISVRNSVFIQNSNDFFPSRAIKASACKISQAKTKDDSAKLAPDGKINDIWNKELMLQIDPFLCQVNFSFLLLEVCVNLLLVISKLVPFQFVHFEHVHMRTDRVNRDHL